MTVARAIREYTIRIEPWSAVERWAKHARYGLVESTPNRRLYRRRGRLGNPSTMVAIVAVENRLHLEAWVTPSKVAQWLTIAVLPSEMTIERGGFFGSFPRWKARGDVNRLLEALGQEPISHAVDPDGSIADDLRRRISRATAESERGDYEASRRSWVEFLPNAEALFGSLHGIVLTARLDLAIVTLELGEPDRAVASLEDVARKLDIVLGSYDDATLEAREALAVALAAAGRQAEARELADRTIKDLERVLGTADPRTVRLRTSFERRDWSTGKR